MTTLFNDVVTYSMDEFSRSGNFQRLFPLENNIDYYSRFISDPDEENIILWLWMKNKNYEILHNRQICGENYFV
jgi:hypothetical protein